MSDAAPVSAPAPAAAPAPSPTAGTATPTSNAPAGGGTSPSSGNPLRDASGSATATPAPAAGTETPSEKKARILKAKVFGEDREFNVDEMADEDLAYRLQMGEAARKHISEAASVKKQFQSILEAIKKDPWSALKDEAFGGLDLDALAEQRLAKRYQESTLPEHDRKVLEAQREAAKYKSELQTYQQQLQAQKQAQEDARVEAQMKSQFKAALDFSGLPVNDTTMYMLAEEAHIAHEDGIELSHKQLATRVKEKMSGLTKQVFSGMEGEALEKYLGPEVFRKVLNHAVSKVKKNQPAPAAPGFSKPQDDAPTAGKRLTPEQIREKWHWSGE